MAAEVHVEPRVHEGAAEHGHGAEARRRAEDLGKGGEKGKLRGPISTFVHSFCVSLFFSPDFPTDPKRFRESLP